MTLTDIRTAAKLEYKERIKQTLKDMPLPLDILLMSGEPVTQAQLDAINNNIKGYGNRERIPEPLLPLADVYYELTGHELLKMDVAGVVEVFQEWKDRAIQPEHVREAWAEIKTKGGFVVGHPRALTVTANGMKAKSRPALPTLNTGAIERTRKHIEEVVEQEKRAVPRPANLPRPKGI